MNGTRLSIHQSPRIADAHVVVVGVGGLGCPAALGLAAAGVGAITLVDPDRVELSNLPRQLLHGEADIGRPKVDSAANRLRRLHPDLHVYTRQVAFDHANADEILVAADFVIDATDGIETKFLINDAAVRAGRAYCHCGVLGFAGQVLTVVPGRTPCLRCLFPEIVGTEEDATCRQAGIVGPVAGLFGALQANHALAFLAGDTGIAGRLISYDARSDRWSELAIGSAPTCPSCTELQDHPRRPETSMRRP